MTTQDARLGLASAPGSRSVPVAAAVARRVAEEIATLPPSDEAVAVITAAAARLVAER